MAQNASPASERNDDGGRPTAASGRGAPSPSSQGAPADSDQGAPAASGRAAHRSVVSRSRYLWIMAGVLLFAYTFDQLTKLWVVSTMVEGEVTEVLPPLLSWHFIRNPGAAFSIGEEVTWVFTIVQAVVPLVVFWISRRLGSIWWSIAFGLLAGGALGNLTDRLLREPSFGMGHVVDFIAFPNFAIFNIADSAVVGAVILICILTLKGIGVDGSLEKPAGGSAELAEEQPQPERRESES